MEAHPPWPSDSVIIHLFIHPVHSGKRTPLLAVPVYIPAANSAPHLRNHLQGAKLGWGYSSAEVSASVQRQLKERLTTWSWLSTSCMLTVPQRCEDAVCAQGPGV